MRRLVRRRRDEDGAIAVMAVFLSVVIFGAAAIAIDIGMLAMERQKLHDAVDSAAHAGAYAMPGDGASAIAAARSIAIANDPDLQWDFTKQNPKIRLWCVVASTGGASPSVQTSQIPATCNPGTAPFVTSKYPDLRCNTKICKIPCAPSPSTKCNTVEVVAEKEVPYGFANIFGRSEGTTGSVASAACKGSCGEETPNPMDIVVVADRTPSMGSYLPSLRDSIRGMIPTMDPTMHLLALGTIDAAAAKPTTASLLPSTACPTSATANHKARTDPGGSPSVADMQKGWWMATQFSNTYSTKVGTTYVPNDRDRVTNAVKCMDFSTGSGGSYYRTHLAAPLRAAVQHLHDENATNLKALSAAAARPGVVRKVVIFETDGAPLESQSQTGNTNVSTVDTTMGTHEPRSTNATTACNNLKSVAAAAKQKGTLIITVGFGDAATASCGSTKISTVLADVATDSSTTGCDTAAKRDAENKDLDYFFCAVTGAELAPIFATAFGQLNTGVKLLKLP
ncbi:hypothetical protein GCM10023339_73150 [Alloalcanivorax gelatiniphagus]